MKHITLVETRQGCQIAEKQPRYNVMYNGKLFFQLYFNMRGYVGYLPSPEEKNGKFRVLNLTIGEKAISAYKKEIALLNREFNDLSKRGILEAESISA